MLLRLGDIQRVLQVFAKSRIRGIVAQRPVVIGDRRTRLPALQESIRQIEVQATIADAGVDN